MVLINETEKGNNFLLRNVERSQYFFKGRDSLRNTFPDCCKRLSTNSTILISKADLCYRWKFRTDNLNSSQYSWKLFDRKLFVETLILLQLNSDQNEDIMTLRTKQGYFVHLKWYLTEKYAFTKNTVKNVVDLEMSARHLYGNIV
jgi:hypothetical protein